MSEDILFGFETALQILRSSHADVASCLVRHSRRAPSKTPVKSQLMEAVKQLEELYPGIQISYPLRYLVDGGSRQHASGFQHGYSCTSSLPGSSICCLAKDIYVAAPPLAFMQECTRRNFIDRLRLGWEICGTYQSGFCALPEEYQIKPLVSVDAINRYVLRNSGIGGSKAALQALRYTADNSASPRETQLALTLGLPTRYGGAGLGIPRMNYAVPTTPAAYVICNRRTLVCDLCWERQKIDVEYQSFLHHNGNESRISDSRRSNALKEMGYFVHCITDDELNSFSTTEAIIASIGKELKKRNRTKLQDYHARKLRLRRDLGLPVGNEL